MNQTSFSSKHIHMCSPSYLNCCNSDTTCPSMYQYLWFWLELTNPHKRLIRCQPILSCQKDASSTYGRISTKMENLNDVWKISLLVQLSPKTDNEDSVSRIGVWNQLTNCGSLFPREWIRFLNYHLAIYSDELCVGALSSFQTNQWCSNML